MVTAMVTAAAAVTVTATVTPMVTTMVRMVMEMLMARATPMVTAMAMATLTVMGMETAMVIWESLHAYGDPHMVYTGIFQKWGGSPYEYGNPHLHTGMSWILYPHMHMGIAVCIWGSPYAYGDFVNANMNMGNGTTATSPISVCIQ
jgi:hypothetical protein